MAETVNNNNKQFEPVQKGGISPLDAIERVPEAPHKVFFTVTDLPLDVNLTLGGGFRRDLVQKVNYCRHYKDKAELLKAHLEMALERVNTALEELSVPKEVEVKVDRIVEMNDDITAKYKAELAKLQALIDAQEGGV